MIKYLKIKNLIFIDEVKIDFSNKLNIISGETGSGKSIILNSINFLIGKKFSTNIIGNNLDYTFVEALIYIEDISILKEIENLDTLNIYKNEILVSRKLNKLGKTTNIINEKTVSLKFFKKFFSLLIDAHCQNKHQDILLPSKQLEILDMFCGEDLIKNKEELSNIIKNYKNLLLKIKNLSSKNINNTIENLQFEIDEIKNCELENEDKILEKRKNIINNKFLISNIDSLLENLYISNNNILDNLSLCSKFLNNITNLDKSQKYLLDSFELINNNITNFIKNIKIYKDSLNYDENELKSLEQKYNLIYNVKRKYGNNKKDILKYYSKISEDLNDILNSRNILQNIFTKKKYYEKLIIEKCKYISNLRKNASSFLEKEIEKKLKDLYIENAKFKITIEQKKEFNNNGYDNINFLISSNIGESLKPISQIASGGELSRIILALKVVLSKEYKIKTLIFDEIDTGVSGRTAQKVAENLALLSKYIQVICVTHLPQLASMGDNNLLIEKLQKNNKTTININKLDNENMVKEIARLISGEKITKYSIISAEEIINMANNFKKINR